MITGHEPGGFRDRCGRCGGWVSLGHAIGSSCEVEFREQSEAHHIPLTRPDGEAP